MDENKDGLQPADPQLPGRGSAGSYPGRRLQKESTARRLWRDYGFAPITVAVMLVLLKVILQIAWVPSGSMEDTLPTRSLLLSWQMPYVFADPTPQRGDVVTFRSEELGKLLVKRVIGLPGDTVSIQNGYVYINGEKLEESYLPRQGVTAAATRRSMWCRRDAFSFWATTALTHRTHACGITHIFRWIKCAPMCWCVYPS